MNANMRRYLDEEWDEDFEETKETRNRKPPKSELAQSRRQTSKEWGRAIAKMHRTRAKLEGAYRKP